MSADDPFERRQLCPDGACLGLIGPDGRCNACGVAGMVTAGGSPPGDPAAGVAPAPDAPASGAPVYAGSDPSSARSDDAFDDRQLCPDGACLGVLLAGRCPLCGRLAPASG